ncbi:hypothetical protein V5E97_23955 [Singulisphaera sp. Ch08]|uniref:LamG domain-containing protein n=1 Tax=Singulisphaera sp. Ch08 TaxID=3120278 RepID=A0AAU7C7M9_9BACT
MPRPRTLLTWIRFFSLLMVLALTMAAAPLPFAPKPKVAGELPLVLKDDFERDDLGDWEPTDPQAWKITRQGANRVLDQHRASKYEPPVRSPFNIALAKKVDVGDLVLDLEVRSTGRDYGHRDLCFVFGWQDPSHFYYIHLGKEADPHANSIFLVDGKPRVSIAKKRTKGTPWTDGWHHVRVVRKVADGLIQVYFEDMTIPAMTAQDKTFGHGRIGVGSFDDTGQFDSIQVWGDPAKPAD